MHSPSRTRGSTRRFTSTRAPVGGSEDVRAARYAMRGATGEVLEGFVSYLDGVADDDVIPAKTACNILGEVTVGFNVVTSIPDSRRHAGVDLHSNQEEQHDVDGEADGFPESLQSQDRDGSW